MKTSEAGVAFIAAHEGIVTRAYRDAAGVWTIGIGHTTSAGAPVPRAGMTITREEAFGILRNDLPAYEARVSKALGRVPQSAFDGAVSFDFNTGAVERASWVAFFRKGDEREARRRLLLWNKAGGRVLPGLVRRREAEARLILDGQYGEASTNGPDPAGAEADVHALQQALATLGLYRGAIDGIAGPLTRKAIAAYQRQHPDLVEDGIAGPATRASLQRDIAARRQGGTLAAIAGGATAAGVPAVVSADRGLLVLSAVALVLIALVAGILAFRYRGELRRILLKGGKA